MKKILITGVSGFAGYKIYTSLKKSGVHDVKGTGRIPGANIDFVLDLSDLESVKKISNHYIPDVIIHLAAMAKTEICENNKDECYSANVVSTKNLVEVFPYARFIYFSTYA
ncbi:MAG: sugar nucleotide-binding protein, partial [Methanomicrobium sp.]|nr:sugar nucleotide-binding protein [Methanomicrobium sp.]